MIEELLARMTLDEKIGQMNQIDLSVTEAEEWIRGGKVGSILGARGADRVRRLQTVAAKESRLGIPLLIGNDVIHGYSTIFPIPLAQSCSWAHRLIEEAAAIAAGEAAAAGTNWIFAPMVDVCRDPRWGRIAEGGGEDSWLCGAIGEAVVRGFQSCRGVAACPKHYVAYGAAEAGKDYNTVDISERTLREVHLPPFSRALAAGAPSLMSAFNEIGGIPASANPLTLRTILRGEWASDAVVLSDYSAIRELIAHGFARDLKEAALKSVLAGVDIDMMSMAYLKHLPELVAEGAVPARLIDEAVGRILRLKQRLGLFENPYPPEADATAPPATSPRAKARELAAASTVLLKNDGGALPLASSARRIALVGPLVDDARAMLGCWCCEGKADQVVTVKAALEETLAGRAEIAFAKGCEVAGADTSGFDEALKAASRSDAVVAVVGEDARMSGEAHCRAHLGLPGVQEALLRKLAEAGRGKPLVIVLMTGRPVVLTGVVDAADAVLQAWHGGTMAGPAVADILTGAVNPSGKLTASFPRAEGQIPVYYGHRNTGRPATGPGTVQFDQVHVSKYLDEPNEPLFPFGFGLSYSTFTYSDLKLDRDRLTPDGEIVISANVTNAAGPDGRETAMLFVRDIAASVTRPVKELKDFQSVLIRSGETRRVSFTLRADRLSFLGADLKPRVEPGTFTVWIGPNSAAGLEGRFEVVEAG